MTNKYCFVSMQVLTRSLCQTEISVNILILVNIQNEASGLEMTTLLLTYHFSEGIKPSAFLIAVFEDSNFSYTLWDIIKHL